MNMAKKSILCSLSTCDEPGDEKCHVMDAAVLRKKLQTRIDLTPKQIEDLVDRNNIVLMCPNHHRIYFDRIKGPKHQKKLLLIDPIEKIYIIAKETIMNITLDDCEIIKMRRTERIEPDYVEWKNDQVDEVLKIKWQDHLGLFDDW